MSFRTLTTLNTNISFQCSKRHHLAICHFEKINNNTQVSENHTPSNDDCTNKNSRPEEFCEKVVFKNFAIFKENACVGVYFQ